MKRLLLIFAAFFTLPVLAATGSTVITWTAPTSYTDNSPLPASAITAYVIDCTLTPTGGVAAPCVFTPASFLGSAVTGTVSVTYPAQGGRACFSLRTSVSGTLSAASNVTCKDFAALTPNPPTNVTITISVTVNGQPAGELVVNR